MARSSSSWSAALWSRRAPPHRVGTRPCPGTEMDFSSDPDREQIRAAVRKLCADFGDTYWREVDRKHEYPEKFVDSLTQAGWLAALIPSEYGGGGLPGAGAGGTPEERNKSGGNGASAHAQT